MSYRTINFIVEDDIGILKLCTPPQNRMSITFFEELEKFIKKELPTKKINGLIISSEGRHFSSGADTNELISVISNLESEKKGFLKKNIEIFRKIEDLNFPTVAAVKGCCFGSGLELALTCKFIVAANNSLFSMPESEFGLMPGCGGSIRFRERAGKAKSIEFLISGRAFDAKEGLSLGIVDHLCDKKQLIDISKQLILKLNSCVFEI